MGGGARWSDRSERGSGTSLGEESLDRSLAQGVNPDLIYLVDLPGFELVDMSVGVVGDDGFGADYLSSRGTSEGRRVQLRIHRETFGDALCASTRLSGSVPWTVPLRWERDEVGWYRLGGGRHEYAVLRGADHLIRLNCPVGDADRALLKAAVAGAWHVSWKGPRTPPPRDPPVRRGDLPSFGGGPPIKRRGVGG
ncbi:hypothetical protein [Streptosporangium sp. NPDC002721]|uniref:hypothetical protein n=1 Tax=Streptosporangium sp. NPDC002721 TaxID=3366188 RepID=UPI0036C137E5